MSPTMELVTGLGMGAAVVALGAVTGFAPPTQAEAAADPQTLRWTRRPRNRRRLGLLIIAMGVLLAGLHVARATMR